MKINFNLLVSEQYGVIIFIYMIFLDKYTTHQENNEKRGNCN